MRWRGGRESENVEDVRGVSAGGVMVGGGLGTIAIILIALFLGVDPRPLLRMQQAQQPPVAAPGGQRAPDPREEELVRFVRVVLADTEDVWNAQFQQMGKTYQEPKLVLFSDAVNTTGCGFASAAVGPFYCPADDKVYLDLSFFDELGQKFQAPGEFAKAYVIAHEIGHHIQNLLGVSDQVAAERRGLSEREANDLSVRLELQADFLAGVWAHHAQRMRNILEPGDLEAALRAANAIGDDRLQRQSRGYVAPDTFTHGTSEQRARWFRRGFESGDVSQGDTFHARDL